MEEPPLDTEEAVRNYVEAELDQFRARHPELIVTLREAPDGFLSTRGITWRITRPKQTWETYYTIEARLDDRELLIWFGYSSAGAWGTHHIMRHAVHIRFRDLGFAAREFPKDLAEQFTLNEVLEEMLQTHYVMNVLALT